jgi:hypothetical protein
MSEALRPMTLGEILDRTVQLYRRNFWLFLGISALPILVMIAAGVVFGIVFGGAAVFARGDSEPSVIAIVGVVALLLVALPALIVASVFSRAGVMQAAVHLNRGEKITIRAALASVRDKFWNYLGFLFLQGLWIALPAIIAGVVVAVAIFQMTSNGSNNIGSSIALGFAIFIAVVLGVGFTVWRALGYSLGLPVYMVEKKPAVESLQRAWQLSEGTRGRIFVLYLLLMALSFAAAMLGGMVMLIVIGIGTAMGDRIAAGSTAMIVGEILRLTINLLLSMILAPVSYIAPVLFYFDQRVRKEGYDIEWMMEQAGLAPQAEPAATPDAAAPLPPAETVISLSPAAPDTVKEP